jgi:RNA recognition motif-containing protein
MRLDRSHLDVSDGGHSVYIGNLPWSITDKELIELFSNYNPVSANVLTNMYGRSRGFAIMKFQNENDATAAIENMNHVEVTGRKLEVSQFSRMF